MDFFFICWILPMGTAPSLPPQGTARLDRFVVNQRRLGRFVVNQRRLGRFVVNQRPSRPVCRLPAPVSAGFAVFQRRLGQFVVNQRRLGQFVVKPAPFSRPPSSETAPAPLSPASAESGIMETAIPLQLFEAVP
jgi:hypothetical protein